MIQQIPEYDALEMYEDELSERASEEREPDPEQIEALLTFREWCDENQIELV